MSDTITPSKDPLGDRMKGYERASRSYLPDHSWTFLRLDGKNFSKYTKAFERPYSVRMIDAMGELLMFLCSEIDGVSLGFCQSDELSLCFSPGGKEESQQWFGGSIQKQVSVAASLAGAFWARQFPELPIVAFDCRAFTVPDRVEAKNALLFRKFDSDKNSVTQIIQELVSHKELAGMSTRVRREKLAELGVDLEKEDPRFMHGQLAIKSYRESRVEYTHKRTGETMISEPVLRSFWELRPVVGIDLDEHLPNS